MAISDTHTLVMLGASITAAMVGTRALAWENYVLNKTGLAVTVVNEGVGGDRLADIDTRLNTILPTYSGDSNVLFCLHGLANDLLDHAPYRDMTAQAQSDLYDEYEALILRIVNNGNRVDIASSTFINFDLDNSAVADEDKGSFAFNQNIVNPIAKIYNPPELYDTVNDRPVSDLYNFTFNSFTEIQLPDGIHYETWGYEALANFRLSRIVDAIYLSKLPPKLNKLSDPVAGFKKTAGSFVLDFRTGTLLGTSQYLLGMTVMPSTGAASGN